VSVSKQAGAPSKLNNSLQPSPIDETTNWKTYSNTSQGFLIKYSDRYLITEEDKRIDPLDWRLVLTSTNTKIKPSSSGPVGNISIVTIKSSQEIDAAAQTIGIRVKIKQRNKFMVKLTSFLAVEIQLEENILHMQSFIMIDGMYSATILSPQINYQ